MPVTAVASVVRIRPLVLTAAPLLSILSCTRAEQIEEGVRIATLRESVRAGNAKAVEQFISELRARGGTPLIEEIPGNAACNVRLAR
jgi:hypothetical protein